MIRNRGLPTHSSKICIGSQPSFSRTAWDAGASCTFFQVVGIHRLRGRSDGKPIDGAHVTDRFVCPPVKLSAALPLVRPAARSGSGTGDGPYAFHTVTRSVTWLCFLRRKIQRFALVDPLPQTIVAVDDAVIPAVTGSFPGLHWWPVLGLWVVKNTLALANGIPVERVESHAVGAYSLSTRRRSIGAPIPIGKRIFCLKLRGSD